MGVLDTVDLEQSLAKNVYEETLVPLQFKMLRLQRAVYQLGQRVVCVFEGWDASGKGGAIKRLTSALDPRGFVVHAVSAPTAEEQAHNYQWRFWQHLPRDGQMVLFDRSWYGRVLVERVEGFATTQEWQQAYAEINNFERTLSNDRTAVIKFFVHISKAEQLKRFKKREADPYKTWKLTDEDWRNRERWDDYYAATNEMLERTSTAWAPWHVVAGNDKRWARISVLRTVIETLDRMLPFDIDDRGLLLLNEERAEELVKAGQLSKQAVKTVMSEQQRVRKLLKKSK